MPRLKNKINYIVAPGLIFIIYLFTVAPSVLQIDSGELVAVQATLGIAHPTGYPLFTLIGYLISSLYPYSDKISILRFLGSIYCASAIFFFMKSFYLILSEIHADKSVSKTKKSKSIRQPQIAEENINHLIILFTAIILGLSRTYWFQSVDVEVYSLHIFLMSLIIYFLLKSYFQKETGKIYSIKNYWMWFALFLALGFSNHMSTMYILPGAAYLYFRKNKFSKKSFIQVCFMLAVFVPVLITAYSYLFIRSQQHPILNWGNPNNLERLFYHVTGKQYQVWMFSSFASTIKQLEYFLKEVIVEFSFALVFALFGVFALYKSNKTIFIFLTITFAFTVLYSANYNINEIDPYFLLAYISIGFFILAGAKAFFYFLRNRKLIIPVSVLCVVIFFEGFYNFNANDQSKNYAYEDYTELILNSVDNNSIIISYQWDYFVAASYYFQFVEGIRKDVLIIDKELLRRSWYYNQINNLDKTVLQPLSEEVRLFLEELKPFEKGKEFNALNLERHYRRIISGIITENFSKRSIYLGPELIENEMNKGEISLPEGYKLVPDLLLFKVVKDENYHPVKNYNFKLRIPAKPDKYLDMMQSIIKRMLLRRMIYEAKFNRPDNFRKLVKTLRNNFPQFVIPKQIEKLISK